MKKAAAKRQKMLAFIYTTIQTKGYPPTVREISEHVDLHSPATVHAHLKKLIEAGLLKKDAAKPRTLEVTAAGKRLLHLDDQPATPQSAAETTPPTMPVVGTVTAGMPITAVENITGTYPIPPELRAHASELFMLQIRGESMIEAGIYDGDYVIVQQQATAENGDIVIAMTAENEATCKKFYAEPAHNRFRLQPCNPTMAPLYFQQVSIIGRVVGLYRRL